MEHSKENRPLIEAHHREAAKAQQPLPLLRPTTYTREEHPKDLPTPVQPAVRSYNKPRVIDPASDSENSCEIPPTEPPPAIFAEGLRQHTPTDPPPYFSSNTLRRKKTTSVFCDSGCTHTLINEGTPEDLHNITTKKRSLPPITRKTLATQITDTNVHPHYPHPIKQKTSRECRICALLGAPIDQRSIPCANHHGRHPHFCPQWARMNIDERRTAASESGFCLQCLDPEKHFSNETDMARHQQHECITNTSKHNRTCSNAACLQHIWICNQHSTENGPRLVMDQLTLEGYTSPDPKKTHYEPYTQPPSPPDATVTPSRTMDSYTLPSKISGGADPNLEAGKQDPDVAIISSRASNPHTMSNAEPNGHDIVPSNALASEAPQTHRHGPKDRPDPEPPDIS